MSQNRKGLKITDIGEFGFIARFSPAFIRNLPKNLVGIGDDAAVIPWKGRKKLLVTTDMLLDGVHFLKEKIAPADLGYKSLAVNLSDIASMGGKPLWAFLSIALPSETEVFWLDQFFNGWRSLAEKTEVALLGGDTTRSLDKLVITVAVLGEAEDRFIKYRSGARSGDIITVTGDLGDSEGGLRLVLEDKGETAEEKYLIRRHYRPRPQLEEGFFLARQPEVRAMMDVSDGIDSDLKRISERSGCGLEVDLENLPVSHALKKCSQKYGWNIDDLAAAGGEDYCLLITVDSKKFPELVRKYQRRFGKKLQPIGRITEEKGKFVYLKNGKVVSLKKAGFDHFRP
jgi:thiamine-monophosphate kinase